MVWRWREQSSHWSVCDEQKREKSGSWAAALLLVTQGNEWVDARGTAGGNVEGSEGHDD